MSFAPASTLSSSRSASQAAPWRSTPLACQRNAFSIPEGVHYLNCAYMAPLSTAVEAAAMHGLVRKRVPTALPPAEFFEGPDRLRRAFAGLANTTDPRRVALVPSVSYAMATAAANLPVANGQNVIVIGEEFPSAVLPWRRLARTRGVELRTVTPPSVSSSSTARTTSPSRGARWNEMLHDAIDTNTAAVVLSHVHWSDGTRFRIADLASRARDVGAAVLVDGTQSIGALPFDVAEIQPDVLTCSGYKWLMGGYGLSLAYFGPRFDGGEPLEDVWTSQMGSDDFSRLADYRDAYRPYAERYDGGQRASFVLVSMLCAAIEQLREWGVENIQRYCAALLDPWVDDLGQYGVALEDEPYRASHLFGLRFTGTQDVRAVAHTLAERQVHVSVRGDAIRVSPHLYNDAEDMAALFDALTSESCRKTVPLAGISMARTH